VASNSVKQTPKAEGKPIAAKPYSPPEAPTLAGWLFPGYLAVMFIGYLLLRIPVATVAGQELSMVRSLFWAVNAATLTGFPQTTDIDKFPAFGQDVIFGLVVCGTLFTLIIGGTAVSRILRLGHSDAKIAWCAVVAETSAIFIGALFLLFDRDRTTFQAVFLAASAFGNSGLILGAPPDATAAGARRLRSKISRNPLRVRNSSITSIVFDSGTIRLARPPVAIT